MGTTAEVVRREAVRPRNKNKTHNFKFPIKAKNTIWPFSKFILHILFVFTSDVPTQTVNFVYLEKVVASVADAVENRKLDPYL